MKTYPEHEKLSTVKEESQSIGEFLEWLESSKYAICEITGGGFTAQFHPSIKSIESLLAEYFEVDLKVIAAEKDAMLEEFRKESTP